MLTFGPHDMTSMEAAQDAALGRAVRKLSPGCALGRDICADGSPLWCIVAVDPEFHHPEDVPKFVRWIADADTPEEALELGVDHVCNCFPSDAESYSGLREDCHVHGEST